MPSEHGVQNTNYKILKSQAKIVKRVFELASEGKGARWIANLFNQIDELVPLLTDGTRKQPESNSSWSKGSVESLIKSIAPLGGRLRADTSDCDWIYPVIIHHRQWMNANDRMFARASGPKTGKNLLQGLLFCESCREPLKLRHPKGQDPYVECTSAKKCLKKLPYFPIQDLILDVLYKGYINIPVYYRHDLSPENTYARLMFTEWIARKVLAVVVFKSKVFVGFKDATSGMYPLENGVYPKEKGTYPLESATR